MAKDNQLVIKINGNIKGYQDALKAASEEAEALQGTLNTIAKTGAVAFAALGASILFAAKTAGKFETIQAQFEVLTGSVEEAEKVIKKLGDFAAKTPFKFEGIATAAKQLLAFKIEGDQLEPTLRRIGDVSAATGASFKDMTLIFGQVKAAGKLTGERLLQLQERAIPIGPALAKTMGVAVSAIRDLVSKGEVDFATFAKAFASLSEKGGIAFEGMEKRSKTLDGQLSTLSDNFDLLTASVGKSFLPVLKEVTTAFINLFGFLRENPGMSEFISRALVTGTVVGGVTVAAALAATVFLKFRASMLVAAIATKGLSFAVKGLLGSTGLGLIVAFLPEIIELLQNNFGKIKGIFLGFVASVWDVLKGLGNIYAGIFTFDLATLKKGLNQLTGAMEAGVDVVIKEFEKSEKASKKQSETLKKNNEVVVKSAKDTQKDLTKTQAAGLDKRSQKLKDENRLIKAELDGQTKAQLAVLKKRIAIEQKERDAQVIQNKDRRALALENIKLSNQQLDKAEKDATAKSAKTQEDKDKKAAERVAKEQEQSQKKIESLAGQNEAIKAGLADQEKEEIEFLQRRQAIRNQTREAEKIKNIEEKNLTLENARLKGEELLEEEAEFFLKRDELKAEQAEIETTLQDELSALSTEKRKALQDEELNDLRKSLETKEKFRSKAVQREVIARRRENAAFLDDEEKFGTLFAKTKTFFRKEDLDNAANAAAAMAQLQNSENLALKNIGKAAALVQIGLNTQKGAIAAYAALAGIPIVGPALGIAAATALTLYGAERANKVITAQTGGVIPGAGFGDKIPLLAEPGELVVPRQNFEEVITAVQAQRAEQTATGTETTEEAEPREVMIGFTPEAADFLTIAQNEESFLGTSQRV